MIIIVTQQKAIVNFNNNSTISVVQTEDERVSVVLDNYVIGTYDNVELAIEVITWIAESIGSHKAEDNLCITMPLIESENKNAEDDRSYASEENTREI